MLGTGWTYEGLRTFVYSMVVIPFEIAMYISFLKFWILFCCLWLYSGFDRSERLSPGESWAGGPPNPVVRLRGRWGRYTFG